MYCQISHKNVTFKTKLLKFFFFMGSALTKYFDQFYMLDDTNVHLFPTNKICNHCVEENYEFDLYLMSFDLCSVPSENNRLLFSFLNGNIENLFSSRWFFSVKKSFAFGCSELCIAVKADFKGWNKLYRRFRKILSDRFSKFFDRLRYLISPSYIKHLIKF